MALSLGPRYLADEALVLPNWEAGVLYNHYGKAILDAATARYAGTSKMNVADICLALGEYSLRWVLALNFTGDPSPAEFTDHEASITRISALYGIPCPKAPMIDRAHNANAKGTEEEEEAQDIAGARALIEKSLRLQAEVKQLRKALQVDGEVLNVSFRHPQFLHFSLACMHAAVAHYAGNPQGDLSVSELVSKLPKGDSAAQQAVLWLVRTLFIHQRCLLREAHTLYVGIHAGAEYLKDSADPAHHVEIGHVHHYYFHSEEAGSEFRHALKLSGLTIDEKAVMGVRTVYQQHKYAQFLVLVESTVDQHRREEEVEKVHPNAVDMPEVIMGEASGHDLYDRPKVSQSESENCPVDASGKNTTSVSAAELGSLGRLAAVDQGLLLALCLNIRNRNPDHGLVRHKIQTYIERLIVDPNQIFVLRAQMLLVRSRLERNRNRVQQRSFLQMQELIDQFSDTIRHDGTKRTFERTNTAYFFLAMWPPIWKLRGEFADWCFDDNLHKTALELYEQLEDWDNIIKCCQLLDRRRKAEYLVKEKLEQEPDNPLLYVALGEATREEKHLWKAWELGEKKMAAPMRALARLALDCEEYEKVMQYFDEAVALNPLFGGDWFTLGYAALQIQNHNRAGVAFTRAVKISPDDSYAWGNLGTVLMSSGQPRQAFNALSQALRNNRFQWQLWDSYFTVATELNELWEASNAMNIILDIKKERHPLEAKTLLRYAQQAVDRIKENAAEEAEKAAVELEGLHIKHQATPASLEEAERQVDGDMDESTAALVPFGDLGGEHAVSAEQKYSFQTNTPHADTPEGRKLRLDRLIDRITETLVRLSQLYVLNSTVFRALAMVYDARDMPKEAYDNYVKAYRTSQKGAWEAHLESYIPVAKAAVELAEAAVKAAEVDPHGLEVAKMSLDSVITVGLDDYANIPEFKALRGAMTSVTKAMKALKAQK